MQEAPYQVFIGNTYLKSIFLKRQRFCQFELTFKCMLHCKHCYSDCYNKPNYVKKELNTKQVKLILDKIYKRAVLWLFFTGGDPLSREDFLEIYSFAKEKGFIIVILTNAYSMRKEIANYFKKSPPFIIEITLNAVTEDLYEKISQVKGSFKKTMQGIDLILKAKIPLRIKMQVIKDNLNELPKVEKFVRNLGLELRSNFRLHACLDGDLKPCSLRIAPEEVLRLYGKSWLSDDCSSSLNNNHKPNIKLFDCHLLEGGGFDVDPYGNIFLCVSMRKPTFNLLRVDIEYAMNKLLSFVRNSHFNYNSECRLCSLKGFCQTCPAYALLETGDMEAAIPYYCQLAKATAEQMKKSEAENLSVK